MKKAIVVIDMPKDCANCELKSSLFCAINGESLYTTVIQNEDKPTWCPLKPLPDKKTETIDVTGMCYGKEVEEALKKCWINIGWNNCLEEIEGE